MTAVDEYPREKAFLDARNLLRYIFKEMVDGSPEPTRMQYDICDQMQKVLHPVVFKKERGKKPGSSLIIQAPRGVGKSLIAQIVGDWALYWNPKLNILVVSAGEKFAKQFTTGMRSYIRKLPPLQFLSPGPDQRDSTFQFDVAGSYDTQHPSVNAVGAGGQVTGTRGDIIFSDDIETDENSGTDTQRETNMRRVTELANTRKPGTVTVLLGTPHTEMSMYNTLVVERKYKRIIWPAQYPDSKWMSDSGHELAEYLADELRINPTLGEKVHHENPPTDPQRYDEIYLADARAKLGLSAYTMQMLLSTSMSDATKYPLKLSHAMVADFSYERAPVDLSWTNSREYLFNDVPNLGLTGDRLYRAIRTTDEYANFELSVMGIDPSGLGDNAMGVCIAKVLGARIFVSHIGGMYGGYGDDNLNRICDLIVAQKVQVVVPESNYGGGMFANLLISKINERKIMCSVVTDALSSGQKERRICDTLEPILNQHRLVFSSQALIDEMAPLVGIPPEKQQSYRFQYQLTRITRQAGALKYDDLVDVLAQTVKYLVDHMAKNVTQSNEQIRTRNLEEKIQEWYKNSANKLPDYTAKIGHRSTTQRYIEQEWRLQN